MFYAGAVLEDHWSWQQVYEWSGFAGLLLLVIGSPVALLTSVVFWNNLLLLGYPARINVIFTFLIGLFCFGVCVYSLVMLVRPWQQPGLADASQDPLSAMVGSVIFGSYALLGLAHISAAIVSLLGVGSPPGREISLNALSEDLDEPWFEKQQLLSRSQRSKNGGWTLLVLAVLPIVIVVVVFATTILPPLWNVPFSQYFPMVSTNAWNAIASENFVFKLYLDVVV